MEILETLDHRAWDTPFSSQTQSQTIHALETGKIIFFPDMPFDLHVGENQFLNPSIADPTSKNVSYNLNSDQLRGAQVSSTEADALKTLMKRFALHSKQLILHLFPQYEKALRLGRTSFRPVEISQRASSYRKDDTRLHVDAFPSTPTQGSRLLRVFSNIHPGDRARIWRAGEPFEAVAQRFLPHVSRPFWGSAKLLKTLRITKGLRTPYDHLMLQIHNKMKADMHYQKTVSQSTIAFMPGHTWIVQTDQVSHAAMSGQHLLEQTFYLPVEAMVDPHRSPLKILERLMSKTLV